MIIIGLDDTFQPFHRDIISRENLLTLTFAQVISKACDFEIGFKTESAITKHHVEEVAHKTMCKGPVYWPFQCFDLTVLWAYTTCQPP